MNLNRKKYFLCFACVLACLVYSDKVSAQFYSVRTNLVGLGTGNLNVEGSMAFSTHWSAHLSVFGMTASLKTSQSSLVCVIGCAKLTEGVVLSGSTVCSPYIMRVVCSDIATVTKAQLSAAGFLRGWCAPFRVAGIWSSNWVWADWERYRCVNCGKRTGKGSGVYVTPTRTAVNLVYLF